MSKENKHENKLSLKKITLLVFVACILVAGVGYKIYMTTGSRMYTVAGAVVSFVGVAIVILLFSVLKNKTKYRFVVISLFTICVVFIGVNIYYLKAEYFIPHTSTSYHNRNAQYSLRSSFAIEEYLKDKVIYMDSENLYYDWEYKLSEYPTMLDIVTMNFTSESIEIYSGKIDILEYEDTQFLKSYDEDDYVYIVREDNWNRDVYFYIGDGYEQSDSMILLCDIHERMFFVTQEVYDDLKLYKEK